MPRPSGPAAQRKGMSDMEYKRTPYMAPGAEYELAGTTTVPIHVPKLEYPISPRENFRRMLSRENPMWIPSGVCDFNYCMGGDLTGLPDLSFNFPDRCDWTDLFGCVWEFIPEAGGSMLKPGQTPVLEDITEWETGIRWPDLNEDRIKACCESVMAQPWHRPDKMNYYDFGQGCTERLVSVLGGYEEAMVALALEPEACRDFMMELSRFHCRMFDLISKHYPTDMILYHDDWGTERDTFFSEKMMEEIVYEPTELFFRHVQETSDIKINFHSCGRVERFMPYFVSLRADFVQLQARANDMKKYKALYGDKLGFDFVTRSVEHDAAIAAARDIVDNYAQGGGVFSTVFSGDERLLWDAIEELYCYSREYYESH